MSTEAHISVDYIGQGISVTVIRRNGDRVDVLKDLGSFDKFAEWQTVDPQTQAPAGIRVPDDVAKALLDALLNHYRGGHDARELRKDYDHERGDEPMSIRVTVVDTESDDTSTATIENDYILVTSGTCHLTNIQAYPAAGTVVLTIKGRQT
jgi:hypothetical protein